MVKTHWSRAHPSGTNRPTAAIPSLRSNGPQKTTSEVRAWQSRVVTQPSSKASNAETNLSIAERAASSRVSR
ncbi:hypothetical protein BJ996_006950 [Streptomyces phaeogriseichromatogenes]|nr:hypothetical protein [Streptomyces murinus]